jgi:hypothetical protein
MLGAWWRVAHALGGGSVIRGAGTADGSATAATTGTAAASEAAGVELWLPSAGVGSGSPHQID